MKYLYHYLGNKADIQLYVNIPDQKALNLKKILGQVRNIIL